MKRINYIEWLRVLAAFSVVIIHAAMGLPNNYSISQLGVHAYAVMNSIYMLVSWAVPVFLMISGALLLSENKVISIVKIKKYILRMLKVIVIFGGGSHFLNRYLLKKESVLPL